MAAPFGDLLLSALLTGTSKNVDLLAMPVKKGRVTVTRMAAEKAMAVDGMHCYACGSDTHYDRICPFNKK